MHCAEMFTENSVLGISRSGQRPRRRQGPRRPGRPMTVTLILKGSGSSMCLIAAGFFVEILVHPDALADGHHNLSQAQQFIVWVVNEAPDARAAR